MLSFIFDNMTVVPDYARYAAWQAEIGDDGIACMMGTFSASGIHHVYERPSRSHRLLL